MRLQQVETKAFTNASLVKISPLNPKFKKEIVPLLQSANEIAFYYQKCKYIYNPASQTFEKPEYPTHQPFEFYKKATGYQTQDEIEKAEAKYGLNRFDIPIPTFGELYKEQAVQPFFVFQIFCVLLWLLDEYWYYSLFTLVLLLIFEGTVVQSRVRNMQLLRSMIPKTRSLLVFRNKKWQSILSEKILPGDICSVVAPTSAKKKKSDASPGSENASIPCDMILVSGGCLLNEAMLTGESVPHLKEDITFCSNEQLFSRKTDKLHIIHGGTQVVQSRPHEAPWNSIPPPPDGGCLGYAISTGFHSQQGKLVRIILNNTDRVTANNKESFYFIGFLLIFAIIAAVYVLLEGIEKQRGFYKLLLNCIFILTSVVPPELPLELSLAVNNSLIALQKFGIFCTEPFRIPFAGKLEFCCFDKTGTLTSDLFHLKGITMTESSKLANQLPENPSNPKLALITQFCLAACQELVPSPDNSGELLGDPIDKAALEAIDWKVTGDNGNSLLPPKSHPWHGRLQIIQRYHFQSSLKRMSSLVIAENNSSEDAVYILCKGAPETIHSLLSSNSWTQSEAGKASYIDEYQSLGRKGWRVLALAYKKIANLKDLSSLSTIRGHSREKWENELEFAGFALFETPIKEASKSTVLELLESSHGVCMITGDHLLTACHVAQEVGMHQGKPLLFLNRKSQVFTENHKEKMDEKFVWHTMENEIKKEWTEHDTFDSFSDDLSREYALCVSGDSLDWMFNHLGNGKSLTHVTVFARTTPQHKESILLHLKHSGVHVLMCGDGTNDVGALKQAHVGVALLAPGSAPGNASVNNNNAVPVKVEKTTKPKKEISQKTPGNPSEKPPFQWMKPNPNAPKDLQAALAEMDSNGVAGLGDASLASPFTCRWDNIKAVLHIVRQGRCTLVTTQQMFKILSLNCLISAYSLSVLYLNGVKLGDTQATLSGMLIAMCFLFISRSQPLEKLSAKRPASKMFTPYMLSTIMGQFVVHLLALVTVMKHSTEQSVLGSEDIDPDGKFKPNLVNTSVFLISSAMQIATFAVNYKGHPFMASLSENKPLRNALAFATAGVVGLALEIMPDFNTEFELVLFPSAEFRWFIVTLIAVDFGLCFVVEWICSKLFDQ